MAPADMAWRNQTLLRLGGASNPGRLRQRTVCHRRAFPFSTSDWQAGALKTGQVARTSPHQSKSERSPSYWRKEISFSAAYANSCRLLCHCVQRPYNSGWASTQASRFHNVRVRVTLRSTKETAAMVGASSVSAMERSVYWKWYGRESTPASA